MDLEVENHSQVHLEERPVPGLTEDHRPKGETVEPQVEEEETL